MVKDKHESGCTFLNSWFYIFFFLFQGGGNFRYNSYKKARERSCSIHFAVKFGRVHIDFAQPLRMSYIFDPSANSLPLIQAALRQQEDVQHSSVILHPTSDGVITFNRKTFVFDNQEQCRPSSSSGLLDMTTRQSAVEERVSGWLQAVKKKVSNNFTFSYLKKPVFTLAPSDCEIITLKLPPIGSLIALCSSVIFRPRYDSVSFEYFDLICIPDETKSGSLYFKKRYSDCGISHTGDLPSNPSDKEVMPVSDEWARLFFNDGDRGFNLDGRKRGVECLPFAQGLRLEKAVNGRTDSGTLCFHCYNKKTFQYMSVANPSVFLNDGNERLMFVPSPMTAADNKEKTMLFVAHFTINRAANTITWLIPRNPFHSTAQCNVGDGVVSNSALVDVYYSNNAYYQFMRWKNNRRSVKRKLPVYYPPRDEKQMLESKFVVVGEKHALARVGEKVLKNLRKLQTDAMLFEYHHQIKHLENWTLSPYAWNDINDVDSLNHPRACLPLASGGVITGDICLTMGKPPSNNIHLHEYIKHCDIFPVIFVSDVQSMTNAIPKFKLNATFIVVTTGFKTLDDVCVSNAIRQEGPQARILVLDANSGVLTYYSGSDPHYEYGTRVNDVAEFLMKTATPILVNAESMASGKNAPLYDIDGGRLCVINDMSDHNGVLNQLRRTTMGKANKERIATVMCRQLTKLMDTANMKKLQNAIIESVMSDTKEPIPWSHVKTAVEMWLSMNLDVPNASIIALAALQLCEDNNSNVEFSAQFLASELFIKTGLGTKASSTIRNLCDYVSTTPEKRIVHMLFERLKCVICSRDSYGKRSLDFKKSVKSATVKKNVEKSKKMTNDELGDILESECSESTTMFVSLPHLETSCVKYNEHYQPLWFRNKPLLERSVEVTCNKYEARRSIALSNWSLYEKSYFPKINYTLEMPVWASIPLIDSNRVNLIYVYNSVKHLMIPVLPIATSCFQNLQTLRSHDFSSVTSESMVALLRIFMRKSIFNTLSEEFKTEREITNEGHPVVGECLIKLLLNALDSIHYSSSENADSGLCEKARTLAYLAMSVMASGSMNCLSHTHSILLHEGYFRTSSLFDYEYAAILLRNWHKLNCPDSFQFIKKNCYSNLVSKMKKTAEATISRMCRERGIIDLDGRKTPMNLMKAQLPAINDLVKITLQTHPRLLFEECNCPDKETALRYISKFKDEFSSIRKYEDVEKVANTRIPERDALPWMNNDEVLSFVWKTLEIWNDYQTKYPYRDPYNVKKNKRTAYKAQRATHNLLMNWQDIHSRYDKINDIHFDILRRDAAHVIKECYHHLVRYCGGVFYYVYNELEKMDLKELNDKSLHFPEDEHLTKLIGIACGIAVSLPPNSIDMPVGLLGKIIDGDRNALLKMRDMAKKSSSSSSTNAIIESEIEWKNRLWETCKKKHPTVWRNDTIYNHNIILN